MRKVLLLATCVATTSILSAQSSRTPLLEIRESTQISNTAPSKCAKADIRTDLGTDVAIISFHDDNVVAGGDPLFSQVAENWSLTFDPGPYGTGFVDRQSYNGTDLTVASDVWLDSLTSRLNTPSFAKVWLPEVLYDPAEKEIFVRVEMNVSMDMIEIKEMRFFLYIVRDGQVADQLNDSLAVVGCSVMAGYGDTAFNFVHDDVAIANPSSTNGTDNIIPLQVYEDEYYTKAYTYKLPGSIANVDDLKVVGFVSEFNTSDATKNGVINAAASADFTTYDSNDPSDPNHPENPANPNSVFNESYWPTSTGEIRTEARVVQLTPNPVSEIGFIEFYVPERQQIEVQIFDLNGKLVQRVVDQTYAKGDQKVAFNASRMPSGIYTISVKGNSVNHVARLVVQ